MWSAIVLLNLSPWCWLCRSLSARAVHCSSTQTATKCASVLRYWISNKCSYQCESAYALSNASSWCRLCRRLGTRSGGRDGVGQSRAHGGGGDGVERVLGGLGLGLVAHLKIAIVRLLLRGQNKQTPLWVQSQSNFKGRWYKSAYLCNTPGQIVLTVRKSKLIFSFLYPRFLVSSIII